MLLEPFDTFQPIEDNMQLASQKRISDWNKAAFAVALLLPSTAFAQQQQSPSEIALQMNGVIAIWAQTLTQQIKQIEQLQKENADLKKQIDEHKKDNKQ
jgi:hypothetical protein